MINTTLLQKIFYSKGSSEGLAKQNVLAGNFMLGRICTVHIGENRPYPYRVTKANLIYFRDNFRKLVLGNPHSAAQRKVLEEFLDKTKDNKHADCFTVLMDIFEEFIKQDGFFKNDPNRTVSKSEWKRIKKEMTGYSVEIFLSTPQHPGFTYEIFPQISGIDTNQYYGSRIRGILPIRNFSGKQIALGEMKGVGAFQQIAFMERLKQILPKTGEEWANASDQEVRAYEQLFGHTAYNQIVTEWETAKDIWFLRDKGAIFCFLSRFAEELAMQQGMAEHAVAISQSPMFTIKMPIIEIIKQN